MLGQQFGDEFEFGPILVRTELDDNMLFFRSHMVFEGNVDKPDSAKTSFMGRHPWDRAIELEPPGVRR